MGASQKFQASIEGEPGPDRKRCTHCGRVKPLHPSVFRRVRVYSRNRGKPLFTGRYAWSSWCLLCTRRAQSEYKRSKRGRELYRARHSTPEYKSYKSEYDARRKRLPAVQERRQRQRASARGRLMEQRRVARASARGARTEQSRFHWEQRAGEITAELERMERSP